MLVLQRLSSSSPHILAHLFLLLKRKHFTSPPHKLYWKTPHIHRKMLDGKFSYLGDIVQYLEPLNLGITTEPFFILWFFTFFFFFFKLGKHCPECGRHHNPNPVSAQRWRQADLAEANLA